MNLEQQVKHLDKNYRDGNALVSDKEFDKLEKQLLAINPDSDYFTNKNALPLPSLEKAFIKVPQVSFLFSIHVPNFT